MSETGAMLDETARRVFGGLTGPAALRAAEQESSPASAWSVLAEAGLERALLPEEAGGYGVPMADALRLLRVAGAHALPLPLAETMLGGWLLAGAGIGVPEGMLSVAPVTVSEALSLTLSRDGNGWRVSGTASRVPWGRDVAHVVAIATHQGQEFVARIPADGFTVTLRDQNLALEPRDTLAFDAALAGNAVAPAASGVGLAQMRAVGAAMRSLQIAGALERVLEMTVQYAQERVQFGKPIGKFQAVQQNLAVLAGQTAAASAAADLAAEAVADGVRLLPIAAAKARCGEAASVAAGIAHQAHGAIGFTHEHALHFSTKRLWSWRDEFGAEPEWTLLLGRKMARAGEGRLWAEITAA